MNKILRTAVSAAVVMFAAQAAMADPIVLFNTGVGASGSLLAHGTMGDPHYSLISTPQGSTTTVRVLTAAGGWPVGPWLGDNSLSRWIGPGNDDDLNGPAGVYTYRTTFDLTGLDYTSARIQGLWTTDNNGVDILINGVSLGYTTDGSQYQLSFVDFAVTSGFRAGLNTLDFRVNNDGGPAGLRVQMTGTANAQAGNEVPEPGTLLLAGLALAGLAGTRRRGR